MSMKTIWLNAEEANYPIFIENGLLSQIGQFCQKQNLSGKCAIISDSNVCPLYGQIVEKSLQSAGYETHLISFPAGEASKSITEVANLCGKMTSVGIDRTGWILALGGGVTGDLAGFAASIHYRGIPFVQVPTTIVSQVDSSVGGKTGVNLPQGKNLVGSFYQPKLVLIDPLCLKTLPLRVLREGFGEVIKHAVIRDADMLADLAQLAPLLETHLSDAALEILPDLIARNIQIKADVVTQDPRETKGLRALLNFGHTLGHAIEASVPYGQLLHGECVAIGMVQALELSSQLPDGLSENEKSKVLEVISAFHLPTSCEQTSELAGEIGFQKIREKLSTDKKFEAGAIRFVLTKKLGSAYVDKSISQHQIDNIIKNSQHNAQ